MRIGSKLSIFSLAALALVGCSDNSDSNSSSVRAINISVQAGQGDISKAYVQVSQILSSGMVEEDINGKLTAVTAATNDRGRAAIAAAVAKQHQIRLVSSDPNESSARCQWVNGCADGVGFGGKVTQSYQWRSVVWGIGAGETLVVTPFTELAAGLAQQLIYDEASKDWINLGYFSPQSMVQGASQVERLFGLSDIQGALPTDLTSISALPATSTLDKNSLRYGALMAAWAHKVETDAEFTAKAAEELLSNKGQIWLTSTSTPAPVLTLAALYDEATANLTALKNLATTPTHLKPVIDEVIHALDTSAFDEELTEELTEEIPDSLEHLLGNTLAVEYSKGLDAAKQFVAELNKTTDLIFTGAYKTKVEDFTDALKALNTSNTPDLDKIILQMIEVQKIYRSGVCGESLPIWITSCSFAKNTLKLNDDITATAAAVSGNSKAVDIRVTGTFKSNDLQLILNNKTDNNAVADYARVRVFKAENNAAGALGYEINWADFTLQDTGSANTEQFKLMGALKVLYRGVTNPNASEMHYNVDTLSIKGTVSNKNEGEQQTLDINASSYTASSFYDAANEFGSFAELDKFFQDQTQNTDTTKTGLVSFAFGEETLNNQNIKYFDMRVAGGESSRYRFYPDRERDNTDNYGNVISKSMTHDMSICPIEEINGAWQIKTGATCTPKQRFLGKRDVQKTLNQIWQTGALSYVTVPGDGEFFIKWPAQSDSASLSQCLILKDLAAEPAKELDGDRTGTAVLGISALTMTNTLKLPDEKDSVFSLTLKKPNSDRYEASVSLTHDSDKLEIYYNTNSAFKRVGSFSIKRNDINLGSSDFLSGDNVQMSILQRYSNLPHKYIVDADGAQQLCVTDNRAFDPKTEIAEEALYNLTFRGVVYGTIKKDSGAWQVTYIDGSTETLNAKFDQLFWLSTQP